MVAQGFHHPSPGQASLRPSVCLLVLSLAMSQNMGRGLLRPVLPGKDYWLCPPLCLLPPPSSPLLHHQLPSQTLSHSFPRPPTNHPFSQTTQLLCPTQLLGIMATPPPSSQHPPPHLITTLAPPGPGNGALTSISAWKSLGHRRPVFLWETSRGRSKLKTLS